MKMKKVIFVFTLLSIAISCKEESIKTEQQLAIDYLLANGFTLGELKDSKSQPQKIYSLDEAKEVVRKIQFFQGISEGEVIPGKKSTLNAKTQLYTCDEPGSYYISRALSAAISGVDVSYTITTDGTISNVYSWSSGLTVAWSWEQVGVSLLNRNSGFCINGVITYGIDFNGLPLGYRQNASIRVTLKGCTYVVSEAYGRC
ncbi:MAG: hypothetical protein ACKVOQ_10500 [Cyclobacteriaceae bacterium]